MAARTTGAWSRSRRSLPLRLDDRRYRTVRPRRRRRVGEQWLDRDGRAPSPLLRNVVSASRCGCRSTRAGGSSTRPQSPNEVARLDPEPGRWTTPAGGTTRAPATSTSLHVYFRPFRVPRRRRATRPGAGPDRVRRVQPATGRAQSSRTGSSATADSTPPNGWPRPSGICTTGRSSPPSAQGLSATVYTQLSDVEDETNGLLTYDRRVVKIEASNVRAVIGRLRLSGS